MHSPYSANNCIQHGNTIWKIIPFVRSVSGCSLLSSLATSLKTLPSILGVPPSKPSAKDSVLVIVDAQNEYDHGLLAISDVKSSRAVIGDVLGKWREGGGDVVSN